MDVQITIRRGTAGDGFREAAEARARKLEKFEPRLRMVELLFDEDAGRVTAEARAMVPGLPPLVARSDESSRRTALDRVLRKVSRQLRKERSKRVEHRAPPVATVSDFETPDEDEIDA